MEWANFLWRFEKIDEKNYILIEWTCKIMFHWYEVKNLRNKLKKHFPKKEEAEEIFMIVMKTLKLIEKKKGFLQRFWNIFASILIFCSKIVVSNFSNNPMNLHTFVLETIFALFR